MDVLLLDFDGTLTKRDTTRILVYALLFARPWRVFWALVPLFRLAFGGNEAQMQRAKDRCIGVLLRGLSRKDLQPSLKRYREKVLSLMRPELVSLLRERYGDGWQILVVTASAELAVSEAVRGLPASVLGTRFQSQEGVFTGAVHVEGCYGAAKLRRIRAWADMQQTPPRFVEAWSDSLSDLFMMEIAEKRVWICAAAELERIREHDPAGHFVHL